MKSHFLAATQGANTSTLPVWFMRQAGRYLPEYQALRKQHDFRTMSHEPHLISEVTLQPLRRYPLDAAILFSDILTCLEYMGAPFKFEEQGPRLSDAGPHVLDRITGLNPATHMAFVGKGIKNILVDLAAIKAPEERPLIGFVGAPFTLASYLIEGGTSREFQATREFMLREPEKFRSGLRKLALAVGEYLKYQIQCGVKAVQIFDSWVGFLSVEQYRENIFPIMRDLIESVKSAGVPVILYSQPTAHLLPLLAQTGADVLSVDWRLPLKEVVEVADRHAPKKLAFQGNLDPLVTTMEWSHAKSHVDRVLEIGREAQILNRWIFNVGHGVVPETRVETVERIIERVHQFGG